MRGRSILVIALMTGAPLQGFSRVLHSSECEDQRQARRQLITRQERLSTHSPITATVLLLRKAEARNIKKACYWQARTTLLRMVPSRER